MQFNQVNIAGNLTRDPEIKLFANEKSVAEFTIAANRKVNGKERVVFIEVKAWDRLAELAGKYLTKGTAVFISATLEMDEWNDKETGKKRTKHYINAGNIQLLGAKGDKAAPRQERSDSPPAYDDDMEPPF